MSHTRLDIAIIGAGAAGLMAAIQAANVAPGLKIALFDGAKKPGAKILVAGGGRCNVTHHSVSANDFAGSSTNSIKKILGRFSVAQTRDFFSQRGVELKQEETGKLFPVSDSAGDVLNALLTSCQKAGVCLHTLHRVTAIKPGLQGFKITFDNGQNYDATRVIIATGGKSLPKTGSDGYGYHLSTQLGHSLTEHIFPALVPLTLDHHHMLCQLSGTSFPALVTLQYQSGKKIIDFHNSLLCTHFGLSGPVVLDISRYYLQAKLRHETVELRLNMLPQVSQDELQNALTRTSEKRQVNTVLQQYLPNRLVYALLLECGIDASIRCAELGRNARKALLNNIFSMRLDINGDRGFKVAEVTAGGIPLCQTNLKTLESRLCPGLYFCGEILDVDGRIGGFNFQWAWASGYTAGTAAATSCQSLSN